MCPHCERHCQLDVDHVMTCIKGRRDWRLPGAGEGTRTDIALR